MSKRDPDHNKKFTVFQMRREDKMVLDQLRDDITKRLGFKVSLTQTFSIMVKNVTVDMLLSRMVDKEKVD